MLQQPVGHEHQVGVVEGIAVPGCVRHAGQLEGLLAVGGDERKPRKIEVMHRLGIHAEPDAVAAAEELDFLEQRLGDNPFAVIADDDRRRGRNHAFHRPRQAPR